MKKILIIIAMIASHQIAFAQKVSGIASNIHDGDTFKLTQADGTVLKIRLANIDAPELAQAHGESSRDFLKSMIDQKNVEVEIQTKDKYSRSVGVVFLNNQNVNRLLVSGGHAWHYLKYSKDFELYRIEKMAKMNKNGLWRDENPTPPWKYREEKRATQKPK